MARKTDDTLALEMHELPVYSVGVALDEAVTTGLITKEMQDKIINRADEFRIALMNGKVLEPKDDGTYAIVSWEDIELKGTVEIGGAQ